MSKAIEVKNLIKDYDNFRALKGISLYKKCPKHAISNNSTNNDSLFTFNILEFRNNANGLKNLFISHSFFSSLYRFQGINL